MKRFVLVLAVIVFALIGVLPGAAQASPPLHHLFHHGNAHHSSFGGVGVYTPGFSVNYGAYAPAPYSYSAGPGYSSPGYAPAYGYAPSYGYAAPYGQYIPPNHHHHHPW